MVRFASASAARRQTEQAPVEVDIFKDAERRIEVAAKALGHVGNPANLGAPVCLVCHIAAEHNDAAFLNYANVSPSESV